MKVPIILLLFIIILQAAGLCSESQYIHTFSLNGKTIPANIEGVIENNRLYVPIYGLLAFKEVKIRWESKKKVLYVKNKTLKYNSFLKLLLKTKKIYLGDHKLRYQNYPAKIIGSQLYVEMNYFGYALFGIGGKYNPQTEQYMLEQSTYSMPVTGPITSGYGMRIHPITKKRRLHKGIDIAALKGTPITAPANGVILKKGYDRISGNWLKVSHGNGIVSFYAHLDRVLKNVGATVKRGDIIATVGKTGRVTGPHLHFEIRVHEKSVDPLNYCLVGKS